ncbi:MAG: magnesium transporter CorA family protein [Clostridia bacterium]|nr:magnesium transporter CorA family protein [Clostridia bacterium]
MLEIFKTINDSLQRLENFEEGVWVNLTVPAEEEIKQVSEALHIETEFLKAALDEEERARIEFEGGQTLILVDIPIIERQGNANVYTTIPLGIILTRESIVTVCLKEDTLIKDFVNGRVKSFYTQYKNRFILQILYKNSTQYLQYLRHIDKISGRIEQDLHKSMKNKELFQLLKLEKSLVYFSTSLKANEIVLEKMLRTENIKKYPDDTELLEDVIIENKQAIEMATIYSSILSGTMDAFASIISNNVNIVMKFLTSVTIVLAIPTMVASFFGMNVKIPYKDNPHAFTIVLTISLVLSSLSVLLLARKRMF